MGMPRNWSAIEKFGIEQTPLVGLDGLVEVVDQPRHTFRRRLTLDPEGDAGHRPAVTIAGSAEIDAERFVGLGRPLGGGILVVACCGIGCCLPRGGVTGGGRTGT